MMTLVDDPFISDTSFFLVSSCPCLFTTLSPQILLSTLIRVSFRFHFNWVLRLRVLLAPVVPLTLNNNLNLHKNLTLYRRQTSQNWRDRTNPRQLTKTWMNALQTLRLVLPARSLGRPSIALAAALAFIQPA
jgi:hypothetical protein